MKHRNIEIDFLRGIAILLVLFFHMRTIPFLDRVGWMGVDLFFVISGYLVSGLLFKEYIKHGNINGKLFFIRRGFKIYPVFYIFIIVATSLRLAFGDPVTAPKLIFEVILVKNYFGGIWPDTWSLCVEEHFYILVTIGFYILAKRKLLHHKKLMNTIFFSIFILCLINRVSFKYIIPVYNKVQWLVHIQTHFRFDELTFGVMIAWHKYFNTERFVSFFKKMQPYLLPAALIILMPLLIWASQEATFFMKTVGYISLYVGFGLVLIYFVIKEDMAETLNKVFSKTIVKIISTTGVYSYSIYLAHPLVKSYIIKHINLDSRIVLIIYLLLSCILGALVSKFIEYYFLKIRDKYYPSRSRSNIIKVSEMTAAEVNS